MSSTVSGDMASGELNVGINIGESGFSGRFSSVMMLVLSMFSPTSFTFSVDLFFFDYFSFSCSLLLFLEGVLRITSLFGLLSLFPMIIVS